MIKAHNTYRVIIPQHDWAWLLGELEDRYGTTWDGCRKYFPGEKLVEGDEETTMTIVIQESKTE